MGSRLQPRPPPAKAAMLRPSTPATHCTRTAPSTPGTPTALCTPCTPKHQAGTTLNKKRLPPSTGIPLKDGDVLVFGGSSRTHTLRIHQRDALQLLEEQHAALTKQLAEKEIADPAAPHVLGGRRARRQASRPRGRPGPMHWLRASRALGLGRSALLPKAEWGGEAATRQPRPTPLIAPPCSPQASLFGCCPRPSGSTRTSARSSWATYPTT